VETQIAQLERKKEMEEKNYMYFESSLEKARVDEALDPSKMPNISVVQKPSPPMRVIGDVKKAVIGFAAGGLALGLTSAFLSGIVFDGSVKRPYELEEMLRMPLLLTIPYVGPPQSIRSFLARRRRKGTREASMTAEIRPLVEFCPFAEAIRDRLVLYFELAQMRHRPKLVGITGCARGVGVSTLASGLAASLSETGVGRILLVNMDSEAEKICEFFEGRAPRSLTQAISTGNPDLSTTGNLVLATAGSPDGSTAQVLPSQFYDLVPSLRASEFAYIIFDMPPLDEGSVTLALAGSMDKTVLVVEAGRSQAHFVRRAYRELTAAHAKVSGVLNKTRSYGPDWMAAHS
jgi:succinoglycan biosynthesis transport protein ExoP